MPKPKINGASFICESHERQRIANYCKKCDSYLCFDCQMDHFDHAKDNFLNAAEEILFKKINNECEEIKKIVKELVDLDS